MKTKTNKTKEDVDTKIWDMIVEFKKIILPLKPETENDRLRRLMGISPEVKLEFLRKANEFIFTFPPENRQRIRDKIDRIINGRVLRVN
jgi:hypothetical protein